MIAAEIWYYWMGVVFMLAAVLTVVALVAGYLKSVSSQRYPGRRQDDV